MSQHGASRCAEMRYASRYRGDNFLRSSGVGERSRAGFGCAWDARSARAELANLEQNCAFDGVRVALEEQRPEWSAVRAVLRTLVAYGGRRCRVTSGKAADRAWSPRATVRLSAALGKHFSQFSDRSGAHRCTESAQGAEFARHFVGC